MNLARRAPAKKTPRLAARSSSPVQLIELVPARASRGQQRYVLHIGDHRVEVDDTFDEATLRRLVTVLSSC